MKIKRWTIDEKMRLPDWCFGNRKIISLALTVSGAGTLGWKISGVSLPVQICIWTFGLYPVSIDNKYSWIRCGLRETVPTSSAEMDTSIPIMPNFGSISQTPPVMYLAPGANEILQFALRKGHGQLRSQLG